MKLNKEGFKFAKELIEKGEWKQSEEWEPPTPEEENEYIEKHGFEEFGKWHLGIREEANEETKQRYAFIFTSDFKKVDRRGLIAIRQRAAQFGYEEIFDAAGDLLELIDGGKKSFIAYIKKDVDNSTSNKENEKEYWFVLTNDKVDRVGDVVKIEGIIIDNFINNPVVLFSHDQSKPIGVVTKIEKKENSLIIAIRFAKNDDFSRKIENLVNEGILRAVSIGFLPIEKTPNEFGGFNIEKCELLEVSIVSVPANPYALLMKYLNDVDIKNIEVKKDVKSNVENSEKKNINSIVLGNDKGERLLPLLEKLKQLNESIKKIKEV